MSPNVLEIKCADFGVLRLDMSSINAAESRIGEVRAVTNPAIASDLKATFNEVWSECTKHLALLKYRLLTTERRMKLAKAEAVLDKYPPFLRSWVDSNKDLKLKDNQDIRDSFVYKDAEYQKWLEVKDHIVAAIALIEAKSHSFERAYWDCKNNLEEQAKVRALEQMNTEGLANAEVFTPSQPNADFIGVSKY